MPIDADLQRFLDNWLRKFPLPRDPNDLNAFEDRYEAAAKGLPSVAVPVAAGDFSFKSNAKSIRARLYRPNGAENPPLMAWFHGGGWAAGSLDSHDGLCRELSHDLGVAVASVHISSASDLGYLQGCDEAFEALRTLLRARKKLRVDSTRLIAGGDGSGAHLALQATWRLQRQQPGCVDAVLALYPLVKPDFNTGSYIRHAASQTFSRDDAVRAWQGLLHGRWESWDERAVLMHGSTPLQRPPTVVLVAAECDVAHDDAIALHDWMRATGVPCEFFGAPYMPHDFARMQRASPLARKLMRDVMTAFTDMARLAVPADTAPPDSGSELISGWQSQSVQ
jgi:acetyl esterase